MTLPTISHSQITTWRDCQQKWDYRYGQRLVPKRIERPLHVGSWVHACLETHYGTGNWRIGNAPYAAQYEKLFDEEKQRLDRGKSKKKTDDFEPLPSQVERIVRSYIWYNRHEKIETLAVEVKFHLTVEGYELVGVIDQIYRDSDGLIWIRDHKIWDELPDEGAFHTMDPQLTIYLHGAKEALGVEAAGVEYNYVKSQAPSFPSKNKDGSISRAEITTDYPTTFRWLKENGYDPAQYTDLLAPLAAASPLLRRYRLPRAEVVTDRILADTDRSAREILGHATPVRNIGRHCSWCSYQSLCRAELYGLDTTFMRSRDFMSEAERDKVRL